MGRLGQKLGEVGASVGNAVAQTADSLGSRLASSTSSTSSSSSSSTTLASSSSQVAQERRFEADLFGGADSQPRPSGDPLGYLAPRHKPSVPPRQLWRPLAGTKPVLVPTPPPPPPPPPAALSLTGSSTWLMTSVAGSGRPRRKPHAKQPRRD